MHLRKQLLNCAKLYLILDRSVNSYDELFVIAQRALAAGVDIIQLRDKNGSASDILKFSKAIKPLTKDQALYIINDRVDLAAQGCADGVHLGQEDGSVAQVRAILGNDALIGVSCQSLEHVLSAQTDSADYIGFGSVYKTQTKPERNPMDFDLLEKAAKTARLPLFAIGGIRLNSVAKLKRAGISRIAVCRAICQADNIGRAVEQFEESLNNADISMNIMHDMPA